MSGWWPGRGNIIAPRGPGKFRDPHHCGKRDEQPAFFHARVLDGPRPPPTFRDDRVKAEIETQNIKLELFINDGTHSTYEILTGLKVIFQKQLPKMPKEYITRLVYDRRHHSLAIVKPDGKVLGGITFRVFEDREFAEIVFCAIASSEQVKGFGSYLMCFLKELVKANMPRVRHFLTYADNYAVGYFKKQGFTARISLDRTVWGGSSRTTTGAP